MATNLFNAISGINGNDPTGGTPSLYNALLNGTQNAPQRQSASQYGTPPENELFGEVYKDPIRLASPSGKDYRAQQLALPTLPPGSLKNKSSQSIFDPNQAPVVMPASNTDPLTQA